MQVKTFIYKQKKGSYWLDFEPMDHHIQRMVNDGWELMNSANDTGHVRVGKTIGLTLLTGGASILFGASRTAPTLTLTFKRDLPEIGRRCSSCGDGLPPAANFCTRCAARVNQAANVVPGADQQPEPITAAGDCPPQRHLATAGCAGGVLTRCAKNHPIVTATIGAVVTFLLLRAWLAPQPSAALPVVANSVEALQVTPIMDLPSLALRKRAEVEKALGKPTKYIRRKDQGELADEADYAWGIAGYNQSRLNFLILRFQTRPNNYEDAFRLLSLPKPRPPFVAKGGTQPFWQDHPFGTGYTCCSGLAFQSVWISSDWKEMHLLILDLDAPEEWSEQQCAMYIRRTGLPLPKGATFKGSPLNWPVTSKTR